MDRTWGGLLGGGLLLVMAATTALAVLSAMEREVLVRVESAPTGASVFRDHSLIGTTPLSIALRSDEALRLRLVKRGYRDALQSIAGVDLLPLDPLSRMCRVIAGSRESVVSVPLVAAGTGAIRVTTGPLGATVFINGRRAGITPFWRENMPAGRYVILLSEEESFPETATLMVQDDETATLHRELRSKTVALYEDLIAKTPYELMHYSDLVHYYVLKGDAQGAERALMAGLDAMKLPNARNKGRFTNEWMHIYTRYYVYPPDSKTFNIRPGVRRVVEKAIQENLIDPKHAKSYLQQMENVDKKRPLPEAE